MTQSAISARRRSAERQLQKLLAAPVGALPVKRRFGNCAICGTDFELSNPDCRLCRERERSRERRLERKQYELAGR